MNILSALCLLMAWCFSTRTSVATVLSRHLCISNCLGGLCDIWNVFVTSPEHLQWWRHKIETFSALLAICAGNSPVPVEFPTQRPVTRSFVFTLICARINGWVNNHEAGDLRRHCAHYDIIVMLRSKNKVAKLTSCSDNRWQIGYLTTVPTSRNTYTSCFLSGGVPIRWRGNVSVLYH